MIISLRCGLGTLPSIFSRRKFLLTLILVSTIFVWLYSWLVVAVRSSIFGYPTTVGGGYSQPVDLAAYPYSLESNITVNLVLATTASDDISWTSRLKIPNLKIIRYVSNDQVSTRAFFFLPFWVNA